jgi:ubiquitin-protein ligase
MPSGREIRLQADYDSVRKLAAESGGSLVLEAVQGHPPDQYTLLFRCRGIEAIKNGKPVYRAEHRVRIRLPAKYPAPSAPPQVQMMTPVFHPHVYPNLQVCMGSWQTTEFLDEFVLRLGALLQYDRRFLNVRDPANNEAVEWAAKNLLLLPTDTCTFCNDRPGHSHANPAPEAGMAWTELEQL